MGWPSDVGQVDDEGIEGEDVVLYVDDHEYLLPHDAIDKARVQPRV